MPPSRPTLPPLFRALPAHLPPDDPKLLTWRVDRLEETVSEQAETISDVKARSLGQKLPDAIPWLQLIGVLVCLGLFAAGVLTRPETVSISRRLFGVLWPG